MVRGAFDRKMDGEKGRTKGKQGPMGEIKVEKRSGLDEKTGQ
jgi:hypothetical protein